MTALIDSTLSSADTVRVGAEKDDHELLKKEVAFRKALVNLTNELLSFTLDPAFYQTALEWTIELVPDAQAGSLLIRRDDGCYHFEAAVGFDLEVLKEIQLSEEEMRERSERSKIEKIDIHDLDSRLPAEKVHRFTLAGRLRDIQATLSVPITIRDATVGYFNLDNFESSTAFTRNDVELAEAIAAQVAVALYRLTLEKRLQQERARLEHMAHHDPLTSLPNRRLFIDELKRALSVGSRRSTSVGVLFIDLDGFKQINDAYGHDSGDYVLCRTAERIKVTIRKGDVPARFGGDEFAILLMDLKSPGNVVRVSQKIRQSVSAPIAVAGATLTVSGSVGTATYPEDAAQAEELITIADKRMYQEKALGRP